MPALIQDRPVQPRFLADIGAVSFNSALRAGSHSFGVEVFENNGSKPLAEIKRGPVVPILADTPHTGLQGSNTASGFGISHRPELTSGKGSLGLSLAPFNVDQAGRKGHKFTRGQGQCLSNPAINANTGHRVRERVMFDSQTKADMPAIRRKADCGVVDIADTLAGIPKLNPTNFGKANQRPLSIQLADVFTDLTALKAKRVIQSAFSGAGIFGNALEEVTESPVQVPQSLLLACLTNGGYPIVFGPKGSQFAGLARVTDIVACSGFEVAPVVAALLESQIVNKAAYTSKLSEQFRLLGCRVQFVAIAALDHLEASTGIQTIPLLNVAPAASKDSFKAIFVEFIGERLSFSKSIIVRFPTPESSESLSLDQSNPDYSPEPRF